MSNREKQITVLATIAGRNAIHPVTLLLDGGVSLVNLHVEVLKAINSQAPQHSGKPVRAIRYDVKANAQ